MRYSRPMVALWSLFSVMMPLHTLFMRQMCRWMVSTHQLQICLRSSKLADGPFFLEDACRWRSILRWALPQLLPLNRLEATCNSTVSGTGNADIRMQKKAGGDLHCNSTQC